MTKIDNTFQAKIVCFVTTSGVTNDRDVKDLVSDIIRYSLGCIAYKQIKKTAKHLGIKDLFIDFKQKQLRNSRLVLSRIWRAIYFYVREGKFPPYRMFRVRRSDVVFCLEFLRKKDLAIIRRKSKEDYVERPKYKKLFKEILKDIEPIIHYKIKRKLSFIFRHERWLSEEDFFADLKVVAIKNIIKYSDRKDKDFIKKAIMQKINHEIVDIIHKHTTKKRQYLVRTRCEDTKLSLVKIMDRDRNLKYKVVRTKNTDATYFKKVFSIDAPVSDSESTFHDLIPCTKNTFVNDFVEYDFVQRVINSVTCQKLKDYVRIIATTDWPFLFERFLSKLGVMNRELSLKRLSDLAKTFLGLTQNDVILGLGPQVRFLVDSSKENFGHASTQSV